MPGPEHAAANSPSPLALVRKRRRAHEVHVDEGPPPCRPSLPSLLLKAELRDSAEPDKCKLDMKLLPMEIATTPCNAPCKPSPPSLLIRRLLRSPPGEMLSMAVKSNTDVNLTPTAIPATPSNTPVNLPKPSLLLRRLLSIPPGGVRPIEVLARHVARLGPAGVCLEETVRQVAWPVDDKNQLWKFLWNEYGRDVYSRTKQRFEYVYASRPERHKLEADREVCRTFSSTSSDAGRGSLKVTKPVRRYASPPGTRPKKMHIMQVRFSHNDQSETFGGGTKTREERSVLQTAIELAAGLTQVRMLPRIRVCWYDGICYCRTGNRRLAALYLAHRIAPERVKYLIVQPVAVDEAFIRGVHGKRPKLTTMLNGDHCRGKWIVIRETKEVVGHSQRGTEYGLDLLRLLLPCLQHTDAESSRRRG